MKLAHAFLITFVSVASPYALAKKVYCTETNWDTGQSLYTKAEDRFNKQVNKFNAQLKHYNAFDFVHSMLSDSTTDGKFYDQLQAHKDVAMVNRDALEVIRVDLVAIRKKATKSKKLWEKLAEYCYDEDKYDDYKSGRNNMRASIKLTASIDNLMARVTKFQDSYYKEVSAIQRLELIEKHKGSALTCKEAWNKVNYTEITDDGFTFFHNFLDSEHHSKRDHSLIVRQPALATSEYFDVTSAEEAKHIGGTIDALNQLISSIVQISQGETDYLYVNSRTDSEILQDWYQLNQEALPIKLNDETLSGATEISSLQAAAIKAVAIESLNRLMEQRKRFRVILDKGDDQEKRLYLRFNEPCSVGMRAEKQSTVVNGQSLSFTYGCVAHGASQSTFLYAVPDTPKDMEKLVSEFKQKVWVEIEVLGMEKNYPVKFWANGFTRAWNEL